MSKKNLDPLQLWKDRKRIMGMPITFTVYTLKNSRLYLKEGFFNTKENEMLLYRILDIKLTKSLWDKIFRVGSLTLFTVDETHREFILKNIKNPQEVRDLLSSEIEKEREKLKLRGREIYGVSDSDAGDGEGDMGNSIQD